ncbi:conserved hypothetical protein [Ricinus communis]|uniref:Uncharacterized protein n=1 Tax=Ricinus communis TaxID=3988 RepID=B9S4K9_RICCO|nr:conserved hypothetical protein [Ricinus communis]
MKSPIPDLVEWMKVKTRLILTSCEARLNARELDLGPRESRSSDPYRQDWFLVAQSLGGLTCGQYTPVQGQVRSAQA